MIRNIWAVGRNYADHAKELGNSVPSEPFIFLKAGSSALIDQEEILLPKWCEEVHHELEIALRFDEQLNFSEMALALDLTERKKQNQLKEKGLPWTLAKSFTNSCPLSKSFPFANINDLKNADLMLKINGEIRQQGNTNQMIFSFDILADFVKTHFPVCAGDWLLTGTPAGVGKLNPGDKLEAYLNQKLITKWLIK